MEYKRIWKLITIIGVVIIFIDLISLIFFSSTSPNFYHHPINKSYQAYLIKYQFISLFSSILIFRKYSKKYLFISTTLIWMLCFLNALFSRISSLLNAGNIYDAAIIINIFIIFSFSLIFMVKNKYE